MPLETRDLASFAVLAELLHFGRAAARLHVSQPALSKRIKSLEEKVGGPLLLRNRRGVSLTAAGATFYKDARRILRDIDTAFEAAQGASSGELGKLRLGEMAFRFIALGDLSDQIFGAIEAAAKEAWGKCKGHGLAGAPRKIRVREVRSASTGWTGQVEGAAFHARRHKDGHVISWVREQ